MVKYRESSQNTLELNTVANVWSQDKHSGGNPVTCQGAFTPEANEANRANDLHVNQCKDAKDNPAALFTIVEKSELWRIFAPR